MADKTLEATIKLRDEMSKILKDVNKNLEDFQKITEDVSDSTNQAEDALNDTGDAFDDLGGSTNDTSGDMKDFKNILMAMGLDQIAQKLNALRDKFIEVGKAAVEAYQEMKEGYDNLITATGATGDALDNLKDSFDNVYSSMPVESTESLGSAMGEVNTRFGYTGEALETCTEQFLKFSKITGVDATSGVQLVARAMGDAGVEADDYNSVLDALAVAAQASGISVEELAQSMVTFGAPLRAMGMEMEDSIALFATWEKAGVNTQTALSGMKIALGQWASAGKDAKEEFAKVCKTIQGFSTDAEAAGYASEVFGTRAGSDLADAIRGGRFEVEEMMDILENCAGTVDSTYGAMEDASYDYQVAMQNLTKAKGDFGKVIMEVLAPVLSSLAKLLQNVSDWFSNLSPTIKQLIVYIGIGVAAFLSIAQVVLSVIAVMKVLSAAGITLTAIMRFMSAPVLIVIAVFAALIAIGVALYQNWDTIKAKALELKEYVVNKFNELRDNAVNAIEGFKASVLE